jgi:hypothetical protein
MRSQFSREFMRSVFAFRNLRNSHFFHYKPNPRNRVSLKTSTTISDSTPIETGFLPSPNAQCSVGYLGFSRGVRSRVTGFVVLSGRCFVGGGTRLLGLVVMSLYVPLDLIVNFLYDI